MDNANTRNTKNYLPPLLKIKCEIWEDYEVLGSIPPTFKELAKLISSIVYPQNFSLSYFGENFMVVTLHIGNYQHLIKFAKENKLNEVKLFVNTFDIEEGQVDRLISNFNEMKVQPAMKRKNTMKPTYSSSYQTISEKSDSSSTSYENNSDDMSSQEIQYNFKSEKCVCRGRKSMPKEKRVRKKMDRDCIYCY